MQKSICNFDFSDIDTAIREFQEQVETKMEDVGKEAIDYAKRNGDYRDVSGKLRGSNHYEVGLEKLTLINDAGYADEVEARGKDVLGGAALFAEKRLKEIFG